MHSIREQRWLNSDPLKPATQVINVLKKNPLHLQQKMGLAPTPNVISSNSVHILNFNALALPLQLSLAHIHTRTGLRSVSVCTVRSSAPTGPPAVHAIPFAHTLCWIPPVQGLVGNSSPRVIQKRFHFRFVAQFCPRPVWVVKKKVLQLQTVLSCYFVDKNPHPHS